MERRVRKDYLAQGYIAARSAGSHSPYDVYAVKPTGDAHKFTRTVRGVEYITYVTPVTGFAIQCKRHETNRVSRRGRTTRKDALPPVPVQDSQ
jgi:hypothetical protein